MKKLFSTILVLIIVCATEANAQGTWTGQSASDFTYDFGAGTGLGTTYNGAATAKSSVSSSEAPGFLPYPSSGFSRVYTGAAASTGGFTINSSPASITLTASNSTSAPNKFSVYNVADLSAVTSSFFTVSFGNTNATTGALTYAFGNSASGTEGNNIFNNGSVLQGGANAGIFNYLRWDMTNTTITFSYRATDGAAVTINSTSFSKTGGPYNVEVYANNHTSPQEYTRSSVNYTLPSGTFNIWVNGARVTGAASLVNFPRTGELTLGSPLNSFLLQGLRSTTGTLAPVTVGNFNIKYIPASTLPVTLKGFKAVRSNTSSRLTWQTLTERNNSHFEILRKKTSSDDFEYIGKVSGKGNSDDVINYSFTDFNPVAGVNYYQLKQVDNDGKTTLFDETVSVSFDLTEEIKFSHNAGKISVTVFAKAEGKGDLLISDISGRKVLAKPLTYKKEFNNYSYDLNNAPSGIYVVNISVGNHSKSFKFIK